MLKRSLRRQCTLTLGRRRILWCQGTILFQISEWMNKSKRLKIILREQRKSSNRPCMLISARRMEFQETTSFLILELPRKSKMLNKLLKLPKKEWKKDLMLHLVPLKIQKIQEDIKYLILESIGISNGPMRASVLLKSNWNTCGSQNRMELDSGWTCQLLQLIRHMFIRANPQSNLKLLRLSRKLMKTTWM